MTHLLWNTTDLPFTNFSQFNMHRCNLQGKIAAETDSFKRRNVRKFFVYEHMVKIAIMSETQRGDKSPPYNENV
jgi:hypothetical protein